MINTVSSPKIVFPIVCVLLQWFILDQLSMCMADIKKFEKIAFCYKTIEISILGMVR